MGKKNRGRAEAAARGTAADPSRVALAGGERLGADVKLKGVMPESAAQTIARNAGVAGFSFKSSFLIAGAVLLGAVVVPYLVSLAGGSVAVTVLVALPPLLAGALAYARSFIDTDAGLSRGFFAIFGVTYIAALILCWLALYQGVLPF